MRKGKIKAIVLAALALLVMSQGALAADAKAPVPAKPKYKKLTGEVVSVSPSSIVIRSRTKGPVTLAVTEKTDLSGKQAKAGDRARVNYRIDKDGKTATRITVLAASSKAPSRNAAAVPGRSFTPEQ